MSKVPRQKTPKGKPAQESAPIHDARFSNIYTDPRFRLPSKKHTHVTLDKRFARMLHDEDFSKKATVDRYGRKIPKSSGKKELERFYRLEEDEDDDDDSKHQDVADDDDDDDDEVQRELERVDRKYDPAREGGFSSSSSDESSSDEKEEDEDVTEKQGEEVYGLPHIRIEGQNDVPMGEISSRLAVVNLDWDNIRAVDLMAVFSSFCPPSGRILRVAVYPSQFGKERMEREELEGPPKEIFARKHRGLAKESLNEADDDDEEIKKTLLQEDKGEEFDSTKLRRYQLERLRYYYAVLNVSSAETAKALYDATDGTEYLTTANFFDLRFVPDDVSFDDDRPRDECSSIPNGYKPNTFVTDALQHSKVKLTWDAEDNVRKEVVRKAFGGSKAEIEEDDLKAYLGSDTSEDEGPTNDTNENIGETNGESSLSKKERERQRLRAALGLGDESSSSKRHNRDAPVGDMQITFTSGLSGTGKKDDDPEHEETTIEKYMRKERERKQRRKEKLAPARNDEPSNGNGHSRSNVDADLNDTDNERSPDLGFDDPFFTSAAGEAESSRTNKKSNSRRDKQTARKANEELASQQRAELELLMLDDDDPNVNNNKDKPDHQSQGQHFNMKEILQAEKKARRRRRNKNKRSAQVEENDDDDDAQQQQQQQQQAGFNMDVSDPRFAALYQNHEFAIDPTNPRFKDTKAMRAILDESRRKRVRVVGEMSDDEEGRGKKKGKRRRVAEDGDGEVEGDELKSLVERVRGKVGKSR